MNKERAIEIFKNIINDDNILHFTHEEYLQALDYAIDFLGKNYEWVSVDEELPTEDKDYFVTIESTIDFRKRYYIVLAHWEESYTDPSVKGWWYCVGWNRAEEQHKYDITKDVVAWKKVEPYVRSEE